MADDDEDDGGKLPPVDHDPLNEGAVGKMASLAQTKPDQEFVIVC